MITIILLAATVVLLLNRTGRTDQTDSANRTSSAYRKPPRTNPLSGKSLYVDHNSDIAKLAAQYQQQGQSTETKLLNSMAKQPSAIWLVGPREADPQATHDIAEVRKTSQQAGLDKTIPLYVLYAVPLRDACAGLSKGGFANADEYNAWLQSILDSLKSDAVFVVEPDAIGHAIANDSCLSQQQRDARFQTLSKAMSQLAVSPRVTAAYLDAAQSDWFKDPQPLVQPLKQSGVEKGQGIAVNVSYFVPTDEIAKWSQKLVDALGRDTGVVIDTSRNGNGVPPPNETSEARWCNPPGRALGPKFTTTTGKEGIDAYVWIKRIGESDGDCFGNPPAGVFNPDAVLELARNAAK